MRRAASLANVSCRFGSRIGLRGAFFPVSSTLLRSRGFFAASDDSSPTQKSWESIYQRKTAVEHVLLRPDTYVGSIEQSVENRWIAREDGTLTFEDVQFIPALYKIFDEVLVNACDNARRDPNQKTIEITINPEDGEISVFNDGRTVPIALHSGEKLYFPELVFGHLLTGSNFDDTVNKATGGRNGFGAKLANIFSSRFEIEVCDADSGLRYVQTWSENMSQVTEPIISPYAGRTGGTRVTFKPDMTRFHVPASVTEAEALVVEEDEEKDLIIKTKRKPKKKDEEKQPIAPKEPVKRHVFSDDTVRVMETRCFDVAACNPGLVVKYNGRTLPSSFEDYFARVETQLMGMVYSVFDNGWQVGVGVTEGGTDVKNVSFVNSIATVRGGTHVDHIANKLSQAVSDTIRKESMTSISPAQVRNHLVFFVNSIVTNPAFDSQTKETLTTKLQTISDICPVPASLVQQLLSETPLLEIVSRYAKLREENQKLKSLGVVMAGKRLVGIPKLEDANFAGTKDARKCTLIITEGDSAKALAVAGLSVVGRDFYGVYPLRGKLLNVRWQEKVPNNRVILELKRILGLKESCTYETEEERETLRYGRVMLMTDQDVDGSHIKGLFINFVHFLWPNLVRANDFVVEFLTPLIKAFKGKEELQFFSEAEFKQWSETLGDIPTQLGWRVKYYKGLGTSTSQEAKAYFSDLDKHVKRFQWESDKDDKALELVFQPSAKNDDTVATKRKMWLQEYNPSQVLDRSTNVPFVTYSDFVHKELVTFSYWSIIRAIPSVYDGMKPGQRKVVYAAFKKLKPGDEMKVVQFAGYVSEVASYHHGEGSLHPLITKLGASFVGCSHNIPPLKGVGQFGTRLQGGEDAASARYIYCGINPLSRYIFREEDDPLLEYEVEDGEVVQPKHYMPVIPMVLVNATDGIGTGWSTTAYPFNPLDVIDNTIRMIKGEPTVDMNPFYRGYKGEIIRLKHNHWITKGRISEEKKGVLRITELPVGQWTQDYKEFLDDALRRGRPKTTGLDTFIKSYSEHHTENSVDFRVYLTTQAIQMYRTEAGRKRIEKALILQHSMQWRNVNLWSPDQKVKRYGSVHEILHDFFPARLALYEKRKESMEKQLQDTVVELSNRFRFCVELQEGQLQLLGRSRDHIEKELRAKKFDYHPLKGSYAYLLDMSVTDLTSDRTTVLKQRLDAKQSELKVLQQKSPRDLWMEDLVELKGKVEKYLAMPI